ncbi:hypothetical protein DD238_006130 [Peronospora effusa]|uniref:non-specific serine/threonine protein kinase n=1 Tax=Peronospora effusa TaxID=542832 RepID=A0A3M6VBF1_9STRA|nr:hypothetical protein DD238_006130 [Peronospora effusa]RQM13205.1 hypothetical protein DD237_006210 [Peronospora effusa]
MTHPSPTSTGPSRKRNQQQQQKQDETIQQHTTPLLDVVPVKRRRSSAASTDEPEVTLGEHITVEEQHKLLDGAPQTELFLVTIKTRDELKKSTDVMREAEILDKLLLQLKEKQQETRDDGDVAWGHEFAALDSLRRFIKHHPDQARRQLENNVLYKLVLPAALSLRSAMARNALLCMQELILGLKTETITHFDAILPVLLNRACSEKQFLKDLARDVLETALQAGGDEEFLNTLLTTSMTEKNAQIVSVAGLYVTKCIIRMDRELLRAFVLEKRSSFFDEMAVLLNCKVVECKTATRRSCQHTRRVIGNEEFVALVKEKLSGTALSDILTASEMRKGAKPGHAKPNIRERMLQLKKQQQQQKKVQSGGNDIAVIVVAPPPPRIRSSSTQASPSVKYAVNTETDERVAIKVLDKEKIQKQNMGAQIKKEISIMKMVRHKHVVVLKEVLASRTKIFIVLELITGGELFDKIVSEGRHV